jgi:hypothetical protein
MVGAGQVVETGQVEAVDDKNTVAQPGQRIRQSGNARLPSHHSSQQVLHAGEESIAEVAVREAQPPGNAERNIPGEKTLPGTTVVLVASGAPGCPRKTRRSERGGSQSGFWANFSRVSCEAIAFIPAPALSG